MVTFVVKNSKLHLYIGMCKDLELGKLSGSCDMEVHCTRTLQSNPAKSRFRDKG